FVQDKQYTPEQIEIISKDYYHGTDGKEPRYYQRAVIDLVVEAYAKGRKRMMFVMATGTGKTYTAFQILYRLMQTTNGNNIRILYLADRNVLIDQTMDQDFKPFENKMIKIENRTASTSYEIFMSLYQQLVQYNLPPDAPQPYEQFNRNYFDIIMIDECHRGSAKKNSEWRQILDYFSGAVQIGMTATPRDDADSDNSNISYFGEPLYTYSLKQGIEDGFLAPYRVTKVHINVDGGMVIDEKDAAESKGKLEVGQTVEKKDFALTLGIEKHYKVAAERITQFLERIGPMTKTIVFCDEEIDAAKMRSALIKENEARQAENQNKYIMRITASDSEGKKHIGDFISKNVPTPTVVTTSQLLSTGVDTKAVGLIVLYRNITSMTEFKQIIGRGTRIVEEKKYYFDILDFRNATELFFDPAFDGDPLPPAGPGNKNKPKRKKSPKPEPKPIITGDGHEIYIDSETKMVLDEHGKPMTVSYIEFSKEKLNNLYSSLDDFLTKWNQAERKQIIVDQMAKAGIKIDELMNHYPEKFQSRDIFDIIVNVAFNEPMLYRTERAKRIKEKNFLEKFQGDAKRVLEVLMQTYADQGILAFEENEALKNNELQDLGTPIFIKSLFGGKEQFKKVIRDIEEILYAA
ncbi:MAG: DEAD/DEAH box helicase family protein, partial [Spirochaetia bacterium]|nr:DEAD/DEAH box helicase family protein [Spirochaetia bacterium]